ncbi:hypothetical protein W911_09825 [Hyphomicrobium nitrativorans NL23]|uniref:OmpA-like domain-containing protein n=1 Tax=Hyphomicrobium nitrativorans NL23 TaxID=1029756 RepID=V5SH05_9HYPH|nr:OmpA family protein [Hyphomicrobium nitrativorans]AHB50166.1 hypothetical protein W911_09825 [Hyphomicrobium nitrativorans NL23]
MLRRTALVLLGLLVTAAAGIFAADRLGMDLPWTVASTQAPEQPSTENEAPRAPGEAPSKASASAERAIEDTVAALAGDTAADTQPPPGDVALDISRISPDGPSVFAGRAEPRAYITVYADGKSAGTVQADDGGSWSLSTEHKFAGADPTITFESAPTPPAKSEPAPAPEPSVTPPSSTTETAAAEAAPATEQVTEDAPAAAGDVMRKFEELVSEAREDAAREKEAEEKAAREKKEAERRQLAQAQTQAALKAQREAEQAAAEAARKDAAKRETERQTVAAAATATPASSAATDKPQAEAATEEPAASSDTTASASADAVPGGKSTVEGDAAQKDTETKAAMLAAPGKAAKPAAQAPIPVPIMFVYNQAALTVEGERAAELLLEYLLLKRLDSVELTGHADERGTHNYNFDLSRERLEAVSRILTDGGYKGKLTLTPKGKTEPFKGIDRKKYRGEALYQFDRRVELRVTR